jgi:hypothetical protein
MSGFHQPELPRAALLGLAMVALVLWRIIVWIRDAPLRPDPWDAEVEHGLALTDAVPVCHHCLTQVPPGQWFCESCGCAVGPYNNYMPYVDCFSEGEVLRNGVTARMSASPLIIGGYFMVTCPGLVPLLIPHSMNFTLVGAILMGVYLLGLAVFWLMLFKNLFSRPPESELPPAELQGS